MTKRQEDDVESLRERVEYYARQVDDVAGECMRLDQTLSGLRHDMRRKHKAFSLLSQLQQAIPLRHDIAAVYSLAIEAINAALGMDKTIVLTPSGDGRTYRPSQWLGFAPDLAARLGSMAITAPDELARPMGHLLVNGATPTSPVTQDIQTSFELPYFVCVPVLVDVEPVALLVSGRLREARPFFPPLDPVDVETFHSIAGLISAAIQFKRSAAMQAQIERQEAEAQFAAAIQRNLLPKSAPEVPGYDIAGASVPASSVGGDYYDFIRFSDELIAVCLGDISGKGMPAAMLMSNLQAAVRGQMVIDRQPGTCVARANNLLYHNTEPNQFATFFYGLLNAGAGELSFTNAGHNPPMLFRGAGEPELLEACGPILGFMEGLDYSEKTIGLESEDLLVIFSDGVTEAMDGDDNEFGSERLIEIVNDNRKLPSQGIIDEVLARVGEHSRDVPQSDDITMLVVRGDG